jgi:arylsulfatase A-like enzyme
MVSLIDLIPTAYDIAGIDGPSSVQGTSLKPLMEGKSGREEIFCEVNYHAAYEPMRSVRTERYKYIRRYDNRSKHVLPNIDDTPSKTFILDHDWEAYPRDQEMLFDLVFDPNETHNIVSDAGSADILAEMRRRLDAWMEETTDPLAGTGHVAAPSGSFVNKVDGRSAREEPDRIG